MRQRRVGRLRHNLRKQGGISFNRRKTDTGHFDPKNREWTHNEIREFNNEVFPLLPTNSLKTRYLNVLESPHLSITEKATRLSELLTAALRDTSDRQLSSDLKHNLLAKQVELATVAAKYFKDIRNTPENRLRRVHP